MDLARPAPPELNATPSADHRWLLGNARQALSSLPFTIIMSGYGRWANKQSVRRHNSTKFGFELVTAGSALFRTGGTTHVVEAGSVFIKKPGAAHYYGIGPHGFLHKRYITVIGSMIDGVVRSFGLWDHDVVKLDSPHKIMRAKRLFKEAIRILNNADSNAARDLSTIVFSLLVMLNECVATPKYPAALTSAMAFTESKVRGFVGLADIARSAGLSISQTQRYFRLFLKTSPMHYFLRKKTEYAQVLLVTTPMSIKQIAQNLAYVDQLAFSAQFKRMVGMSPTAYRDSMQ